MTLDFDIVPPRSSPEAIGGLADPLVETVAGGGSVSFMHPLAAEVAQSSAREMAGEEALDSPPNQPHRAEIARIMTPVAVLRER